jgi:hypothetical protein
MTIDLDKHMMDQPWSITCSECGNDLYVTKKDVDYQFDLSIQVDPCDCQKEPENEDG